MTAAETEPEQPTGLSELDRATLDLERQRFRYVGAKEARITELFDETPTRYYARLGRLLDDPQAMAYDGQLVKRLRRLREARKAVRTTHS